MRRVDAFGWFWVHLCRSVRSETWCIHIRDMRTGNSLGRSHTYRCTDGRCSENTHRCLGGGAQRGSKSCEIDAWTCSNTRLVPIRYLWCVTERRPTFTGVPILPEVVALSAVALVGAVDVGTLLAARAAQTLVHIWRLVVRAHYCHSSPDQRTFNVFSPNI